MKKRRLSLTLALLAVSGSPALADWTAFRGSAGNGFADAPDLPVSLDEKKSISWKTTLPGRGLSCPVVVGDRVFLTASSGPRQERLHVLAFSTADGTQLWERQFVATGRTNCHKKTCVAAPTPVSDGKLLVAQFSSNDVFCLDLDGNLKWLRGLTNDYPNAANSLGMSSSPVIAGGVLVTQVENDADSFAAALDLATGKTLWLKARPKGANWTSPAPLLDADGKTPLVALQSKTGVLVVEPRAGSERWTYADGASTIPSSTFHAGKLYIPSHGLTALLPGKDGRSHKQVWQENKLRPGTASPVASGGKLYVINNANVLTAADPAAGSLLWRLRVTGPFSASPVANKTHAYLLSEKGLLQVVDLRGKEGKIVSTLDLAETHLGTPAISGNALYLRSDQHLRKIGG